MKFERYLEWWDAVRRTHEGVSWWRLVIRMGRAVISGWVSVLEWRRRMKVCGKCPLYRHALRTCGIKRGSAFGIRGDAGCGCYVPMMARSAAPYRADGVKGCWGRVVLGPKFGW